MTDKSEFWDGETVYAPTRMQDWNRCPLYLDLKRKWEPIVVEWEPNLVLGRALNDGLSVVYRAARDGKKADDTSIWAAAHAQLEAGFEEGSRWTLEGLEKLLEKILDKAIAEDMVQSEAVLLVDESTGKGKPDLVTRRPDGTLRVVDTKFRMRMDPQYAEKTLSEYDTDDQMWHYAWEVEQYFGEPVSMVQVHHVTASPSVKSRVHPITITPEKVRFWAEGAKQTWMLMKEGRVYPKFSGCKTKYGPCPYYVRCHSMADQSDAAMENFFRRVSPRDRENPHVE